KEKHCLHAAFENVGLDSGAEGDDFIGIQLDMRLAAEEFLHGAANQRGARGAADEDDFVDVDGLELRVGKRLLDGTHGAANYRANERSEERRVGKEWRSGCGRWTDTETR